MERRVARSERGVQLGLRAAGLVTAAGDGLEALRALVAGQRTALAPLPEALARGLPRTLGARVPGASAGPERGEAFALAALEQALRGVEPAERARIPLLVGTGLGPQEERELDLAAGREPAGAHALTLRLAERCGLDLARSLTYSVTCVSGSCALERARGELLRAESECPAVLVLGLETLSRTIQAGFCALEALSASASPSQPAPQDGIVLGEGACALLLARAIPGRPALLGHALVADASHMTSPDTSGAGMRAAIEAALAQAQLRPQDLRWIALTAPGSPAYAAVYAAALAPLLPDWRGRVVSWEASVGHLLAASGPLGLAFAREEAGPGLALTVGFGGLNAAAVSGLAPPTRAPSARALPAPLPAGSRPSTAGRVRAVASARAGSADLEDAFPQRWDPRRRIGLEVAPLVEAACRALRAAGWWAPASLDPGSPHSTPTDLSDLALVVAVDHHGEVASRRFAAAQTQARPSSPAAFLTSLPSTPATTLSLLLGAKGHQATINSGPLGGAAALAEARLLLARGVARRVLVGALSATPDGVWRGASVVLLDLDPPGSRSAAQASPGEPEGPNGLEGLEAARELLEDAPRSDLVALGLLSAC